MIVIDTGALFATLVATEIHHDRARTALEGERPPYILSPFVLCELDYLLATRTSVETELRFLTEVAEGAYELASFDRDDVAAATNVVARYRDLGIGLADASVVVLADRLGTDRVFTLDERHFRTLRTRGGGAFTLLPADAEN